VVPIPRSAGIQGVLGHLEISQNHQTWVMQLVEVVSSAAS